MAQRRRRLGCVVLAELREDGIAWSEEAEDEDDERHAEQHEHEAREPAHHKTWTDAGSGVCDERQQHHDGEDGEYVHGSSPLFPCSVPGRPPMDCRGHWPRAARRQRSCRVCIGRMLSRRTPWPSYYMPVTCQGTSSTG